MKPYMKKEMEEKAIQHTEDMAEEFKNEILYSVKNSVIYRDDIDVNPDDETHNIGFIAWTTSEAVFKLMENEAGNVTVLNYASYKWPGGGFIKGSMAQEEALCHDSVLYNVISDKKFAGEYASNREDLHKSLYTNFAIFSPDVVFVNDDNWFKANVLTCPSPNFKAAQENGISYHDNLECLRNRAEFMLKVAKKHNTDTLILGAWGCGVFGQNVMDLAHIFKELLSKYKFNNVIFAIPDKDKLDKFRTAYMK